MKLKRLPEDFQVEEEVELPLSKGGVFAAYRVKKQGLSTLEAIEAVVSRWKVPRESIAFAGLKDKHALTVQHVTILFGPPRGLTQTNLELEYLGQAERPIHSRDIVANRFEIVIRDLTAEELENATRTLTAITRDGLPNYFDNQRFGSLGVSGEFIAKPWCLGDYERTLWLAIAEENVHDRPDEQDQKRMLREHWGDWNRCRELLGRSPQSAIVTFLSGQPNDFRRAIALVRQDLRSIWLAAFQSHLWNQILAGLIRHLDPAVQCSIQTIGRREIPIFLELNNRQRPPLQATPLPLPSARLHLEEGPLKALYDRVLAAEGIELRQIRVKYPRDSFFSKGERGAVFRAGDLAHETADDDLYPGSRKLTLRFTLPRGSYATILVKRVTGTAGDELTDAD